jgi:ATP adenylyltransferase
MAEQRLWAPWRLRYVQGERKDERCIFCLGAASADNGERHVLARGEHCFVMLNAFPYNSGHLMVSPLRHVASIADLDDDGHWS